MFDSIIPFLVGGFWGVELFFFHSDVLGMVFFVGLE